jgi:hypothetical protein
MSYTINEAEELMLQSTVPSYFEEMEEVKVKYHLVEEPSNEESETE